MQTQLFPLVSHGIINLWNKYVKNESGLWDKLYKEDYAAKMNSLDQRVRHYVVQGIISESLEPCPSVLDIGCGVGSTFEALKKLHLHYHGVDVSETAIKKCKHRYAHFTHGDFSVLDFAAPSTSATVPGTPELADEKYDFIVINEVLYYFAANAIPQILEKAKTKLRAADSLLIVSMSKSAKSKPIWKQIRSVFPNVIHDYGLSGHYSSSQWQIRSYSQ